jgi:hypothetical protein
MVYWTLFFIGLFGLAAVLALGMGHGGAGGHHLGHGAHGHAGHGHDVGGVSVRLGDLFWSLLSPLAFLSICLGVGATGLILQHHLASHAATAILAATGGLALYGLAVRPLTALIFRFESEPSKALEGVTAHTVEAASHFDTAGKGIVLLNVDGQIVRVLATLDAQDQAKAGSIEPGETLTVVSVDGHKNTCRVARL